MKTKIRWGILGTGNIAHVFARALSNSVTSELYAVGSRNKSTANSFASLYKAPKNYSSYDGLLADPEVDAIYIALPHLMHAEWAIKAAYAKKHILCEKPLTMSYKEALAVIEATKSNNVLLMEAFVFRMHPQTEKLKDLIKSGAIGDLSMINATFSFKSDANEIDRKKIKALGGGGILDVGCYPISMINLIACQATGKYQIEPEEIVGLSLLDKEGIDDLSVCNLKFSEGILAVVSCGISLTQENGIKIFGSEGSLSISSPWVPGGRNPGITKIVLQKNNSQEPELFFIETNIGPSNFMIDHFVKSMTDIASWGLYANESLANMKTLDRWRASAGVAYQSDN